MARPKTYILTGPAGEVLTISNLSAFCRNREDWDHESARKVVDTSDRYKGWKIERQETAVQRADPNVLAVEPPAPPTGGLRKAPNLPDFVHGDRETIKRGLRAYVAWLIDANAYFASNPSEEPASWKLTDSLKLAETMAKMSGIDWKEVGDNRTLAERVESAVEAMLKDGEEALCMDEEVANVLIERFAQIDRQGMDFDAEMNEKSARGARDGPKARAGLARRWMNLLRTILYLRERVKKAYDPHVLGVSERVQRATHILRFMIYTGRSDRPSRDRAGKVFLVGRPQIAMAMTLFYAINGAGAVDGVGLVLRGDPDPMTGGKFEGINWRGWVAMIPPRHGKTDFLKHDTVLTMNLQDDAQQLYVHAVDEEAESMNKAVAAYFTRDTAQGRRNLSLFPAELAASDNNATSTRIKVRNPPRCPQHTGVGIGASGLGKNADRLKGDDLVPTSDRFNQADREKRKATWDTTWMSRRQDNAFTMLTGYPHHRDDLMWQYALKAEEYVKSGGDRGMAFWLLKMPVGGPDTTPAYRPVFPELYDARALRALHQSYQDATIWPSNYMMTPQSPEKQIVKVLRLYDPASEEHREFLDGAEILVGVDPAAKGDGTGDMAAVVVAALGDARGMRQGEDSAFVDSERQLRIIYESEFHATQSELTQNLLALGVQFRVDRVFIECVTGLGSSIAEMLATYHGVHAVELEGVRNRNKRARLQSVSAMLEDANPSVRAKVLFPGTFTTDVNGSVRGVIHESMHRLAGYIVDFDMTTGHHSLDAATLICRKVMSAIGVGQGAFSEQVVESVKAIDPRLKKLFDQSARRRSQAGNGFKAVLAHQGA